MNNFYKKYNVSIGLVNPKSPHNVGSVMRAAGNFGVSSVFYTGKRYPRALMRNSALPDMHRKVSQNVSLSEIQDIIEDAPVNKNFVCIEFAENAVPLMEFQHPDNAFYIFGPEDGTLNQKIINKADDVIFVPTIGCMNLSATVNVVLYDRLSKLTRNQFDKIDRNVLIRLNRDVNNNLIVKS